MEMEDREEVARTIEYKIETEIRNPSSMAQVAQISIISWNRVFRICERHVFNAIIAIQMQIDDEVRQEATWKVG